MLLSKTWPFESKLSDTSFKEQLEQNMHNLQSKKSHPVLVFLCEATPVLQTAGGFPESAVMQEERRECKPSEEERP